MSRASTAESLQAQVRRKSRLILTNKQYGTSRMHRPRMHTDIIFITVQQSIYICLKCNASYLLVAYGLPYSKGILQERACKLQCMRSIVK